MERQKDNTIGKRLVSHLSGGQAFSPIEKVLDEISFDKTGIVPDGLPYSFYQVFAHIRIAQLDILEYCISDDYQAQDWPADYWPDETAPDSREVWNNLKEAYFSERRKFCDVILNSDSDSELLKPFEANKNHNLLRQAELIIEHTAYHTGQLYVIYRLVSD